MPTGGPGRDAPWGARDTYPSLVSAKDVSASLAFRLIGVPSCDIFSLQPMIAFRGT